MTADNENISAEALVGLCHAARAAAGRGPEVELLNIHDALDHPLELRTTKIYRSLASKVAAGPVMGVISLLASPDSPPMVRFCRAMQIPLLLAVAANDDLLAPPEDTSGIVFRMTPTNGQQASDIAKRLQNDAVAGQTLRVAVFHEANTFGEFLQQRINDLLNKTSGGNIMVFNYEVSDQPGFSDLMPQLWCGKTDRIVYLGFASRALELLNTLRWYRADPDAVACTDSGASPQDSRGTTFKNMTVLLSSGAYDEDLNDPRKYSFSFKVFAFLPIAPVAGKESPSMSSGASRDEDYSEASRYGFDSYAVLDRLAKRKFEISSAPVYSGKTGHVYSFDEKGELTPHDENTYKPYLLRSSSPAGTP
jgi:hypothetical protein